MRIREKMRKEEFYSMALAIAIPVALQNLIASSINMLDTMMITTLGEANLAAVGLANQIFFVFSIIIFGISTGSSVFISQYWGKRDRESIKKILGIAMTFTIILGIIFTIAIYITPDGLMRLLTDNEEVVTLGAKYLIAIAPSYIITGISLLYGVGSRSVGQARMPMIVSFISFVTNAFFNYVLIFGKLGFPRLAIKGAAYGTVIARIVELIIILYAIYSDRENPLAGSIKELLSWDREFLKRYLNTTYPVILNETFWSLGTVLYSVAYAKVGVVASAAVQILSTVQNIFMVLTRGLASACTIIVGTQIGSGKEDKAIEYAKKFIKLSCTIGIVIGVFLFFGSELVLKAFRNLTPELYETSNKLIKVLGIYFVVRVFNGTVVVGILRGGGDTKFAAFLEAGAVWLVGVPLAFLGAVVFKLPVHLVVALVYTEELVTAIIGAIRVRSEKWVKNVID